MIQTRLKVLIRGEQGEGKPTPDIAPEAVAELLPMPLLTLDSALTALLSAATFAAAGVSNTQIGLQQFLTQYGLNTLDVTNLKFLV